MYPHVVCRLAVCRLAPRLRLISREEAGTLRTGHDVGALHLTGADLTEAHLTGAKLVEERLNRTDLGGADLTGAKLVEANLTGANLTGANLTKFVRSSGAGMTKAARHGRDRSQSLNQLPDYQITR
jgi:uncharacterized protein YjbI with pentapeptide repeats